VGKGTAFTLYFPLTRENKAAKPAALGVDAYLGKHESILVVDDVAEQREIACDILTRLGYNAMSCASGEEAVVYLKAHRVDLVILDVVMDPGMDGLQTYRKICELHPGQRAIFVSGFAKQNYVEEAQRLGAGAYLKKPYTMEKIGFAVKVELARK
jgi:CheY-like chemotaxis protein